MRRTSKLDDEQSEQVDAGLVRSRGNHDGNDSSTFGPAAPVRPAYSVAAVDG